MNRRTTEQITQTLHTLLPAYQAAAFPGSLLDLAGSLLTQSQSRVATLKPEEEPARCFAVCEIACHRLKTRLNLPKVESRPPCPPRTYKKLYQLLVRVLEAPKIDNAAAGSDSPYGVGRITTPLKAKPKSAASTPASASRKTGKRVLPLLKPDSNRLDEPQSHVPTKKRKADDGSDDDETITLDVGEVLPKPLTERERPSAHTIGDVHDLGDEDDRSVLSDVDDQSTAEPIAKGGLGSLMENQWDFLRPEKKADYKRWEASMMRRIEIIERSQSAVRAKG